MFSINHATQRAMARKDRVSPFNMIEITVAIGVVAIGMVSLMALFPIGFNAHRDAIGELYASDLADQFLHVEKYDLQKDPTTWDTKVSALPSSKPTIGDDAITTKNATAFGGVFSNMYTANNSDGSTAGYYVEMKTDSMVDFNAQVLLWKTDVNVTRGYNLDPWHATDEGKAIGLNVEISWPAGKPYKEREKRCYHLEVFKP